MVFCFTLNNVIKIETEESSLLVFKNNRIQFLKILKEIYAT